VSTVLSNFAVYMSINQSRLLKGCTIGETKAYIQLDYNILCG